MSRVTICIACVVLLQLRAVPDARTAGCIIGPCSSSASSAGGTLLVCPAGDGPTLSSIGATVSVTVLSCDPPPYVPVTGIPAEEFWIVSHNTASLALCGAHRSSDADADVDENGQATISGSVAAGGYSSDVHAVAQGMVIGLTCELDVALPLVLVSPDINGDLVVSLVDLSSFAEVYSSNGALFDPRMDFNGDGHVGLADLALFAEHHQHTCNSGP
jgi:hypothetical protein